MALHGEGRTNRVAEGVIGKTLKTEDAEAMTAMKRISETRIGPQDCHQGDRRMMTVHRDDVHENGQQNPIQGTNGDVSTDYI